MTDARAVLGRVTDAVGYLRVEVGLGDGVDTATCGADDPGWLPSEELCTDPDLLREVARATAAGRGTDRDDVALSLFVQGYSFRIASLAIGAWLLDGALLDVAPERTAVALGRHRPNAVRFDRLGLIGLPAGRGEPQHEPASSGLHATLIDGHLAMLVDTAHRACRVGEALLWSNVGAACASSFGAFMAPLAHRQAEVRDRARGFFADALPALAASGRLVPVGSVWAWERQACCLWYRTDGGGRCADCSLWTAAERQERYDAAIAAEGGATP